MADAKLNQKRLTKWRNAPGSVLHPKKEYKYAGQDLQEKADKATGYTGKETDVSMSDDKDMTGVDISKIGKSTSPVKKTVKMKAKIAKAKARSKANMSKTVKKINENKKKAKELGISYWEYQEQMRKSEESKDKK